MFRNKYYAILVILAMVAIFSEGAFAQVKKENITEQVQLLKEYSGRREDAKALKLAKEILQVEPDNITALNLLAETQISMGNLPAAEETVNKALRLQPNDRVACRLSARIYRLKSQRDPKLTVLALEQVQKCLVSHPDDIMLLAEEAQIYSARGHKTKAVQAINRALAISPDNKYLKDVKATVEAKERIEEKEAGE